MDIENRLTKHNNGLIKSTRHRAPFELIYTEKFDTRREAMLREKHLKSLGGIKEKKAIITNMGL